MIYRRVLTAGATAAVIVGAGTAALATTSSDTTAGTPTTSSSAPATPGHAGKAKRGGEGKLLRRAVHAQIVTKGKDGSFVTHDLITGTVTAVSATSITVQAADKTSETFVVNADTKVRLRTNGKGAPSTIDKVAQGDTVLVTGTGTATMTAKHIVDRGK
ncbi:MAG TPA: hypothetical protein VGN18_12020 [Jatrophihabitans sp.]|uniref:hypothetical protein n=1 Tax=Jatrophihabitans sp. TaxID=1932789 RepID=UPI002E0B3B1A|nr:hypothetical protein [Jatrophihabitans sp.]